MKKEVITREKIIIISYGDEFAILTRKPVRQAMQAVTFSIPVTAQMSDYLESSKIVKVQSYTVDGMLFFERRFGYDNFIMIEILMDLLERKHNENKGLIPGV